MIHPALKPRRTLSAVRRAQLVQHSRLVVGVGSVAGGLVLLSTNVLALVAAAAPSIPWTPLVANVALIFGGAMFLRRRPG